MSAFQVSNDTLDLLASFLSIWSPSIGGTTEMWLNHPINDSRLGELKVEQCDCSMAEHAEVKINYENAPEIKRELLAENIASLEARYIKSDHTPVSILPFRVINSGEATFSEVAGAIKCYEYQSCESDDWIHSYAFALCEAARKKLVTLVANNKWEYHRETLTNQLEQINAE